MLRELRLGLRALRADPTFTAVAVACMGLGIGAVVIVFTIVNAVVFRPLPFAEPDRVVMLRDVNRPRGNWRRPTLRTTREWQEHARAFAGFAVTAFNTESMTLSWADRSEPAAVQRVGPGLFDLLGVEPLLGRSFRADDPVGEGGELQTILLSEGYWQRRFAGDDVLGRSVRLRGRERLVVGIVPAGFYVAPFTGRVDVYAAVDPTLRPPEERLALGTIARLAPGVTHEAAAAEADTLARAVEPPDPAANYRYVADDLLAFFSSEAQPTFVRLLLTVALLLVVACVNVAALLLARTARRRREIATRAALGATRSRVVVEVLVESALLASMGGAVGILGAYQGVTLFAAFAGFRFPPEILTIDPVVLGVAVAAAFISAVGFGALPAWNAARADVGDALRGLSAGNEGRSAPRLRGLLLVCELALAQLLLINAGLAINSLFRVLAIDPGFESAGRFTAGLRLDSPRYLDASTPNTVAVLPASDELWRGLLRGVRGLPEVESAALTSQLPGRIGRSHPYELLSAPMPEEIVPRAPYYEISTDYFETLGIPLRAGRLFDEDDRAGTEAVAIVSERLARDLFGEANAVGHTLQVTLKGSQGGALLDRPRTIVGVVGDVRHILRLEPSATVYVPDTQHPMRFPADERPWIHLAKGLVAVTSTPRADLVVDVRQILNDLDPELAPVDAAPLLERLRQTVGPQRIWARLYSPFAVLSLLLAAVGVYGLVSHSVTGRTREFGVRLALGAEASRILRLVHRETALLTGLGLLIGSAGAVALNRVIASRLFGLSSADPGTHLTVVAVLMVTVFGAAWLPARRATRVSPLEALRTD